MFKSLPCRVWPQFLLAELKKSEARVAELRAQLGKCATSEATST